MFKFIENFIIDWAEKIQHRRYQEVHQWGMGKAAQFVEMNRKNGFSGTYARGKSASEYLNKIFEK